ncbi:hypothetical protein KAR91_17080 [Candidatus Pacearchaeota archaeon]|nr:hypothetical protein [Candidatus Pacearchaeota archaeon]
MSMSAHIIGFIPAGDQFKRMKEIWDKCTYANIEPPGAVLAFFDHTHPGDKPGLEVEIQSLASEHVGLGQSGYELELSTLPENVKFIRFYNSW